MNAVDIIIVNYRTPDYLERALWSLNRYRPTIPNRVWVVNVTPEPEDMRVAQRQVQWLTHVALDYNVGYSGACNFAAKLATTDPSDTLGFFNADIEFLPDTIDKCVTALHSSPEWGVLGPLQYDHRGLTTHAGIFGTREAPKHRAWHRRVSDQYRDVVPAVTVSGSAYFIKRSVWDELMWCPDYYQYCKAHFPKAAEGAFLPTPHYFEETFCSYHAYQHGYGVIYYGHAEMIHDWKRSPGPVDGHFKVSQRLFRDACDAVHHMPHD